MPQRSFPQTTTALSGPVGANAAILRGRRWVVQPSLPSPLDATTQAATYRAANRAKSANISVWLGVRYGQAPIGALRFKPCVRYDYPAGQHDAAAFGPVPWQTSGEELDTNGRTRLGLPTAGAYNWPAFGSDEGEDCLRVHIFAPEGLTDRPVIFHIHGGGWGVYSALGPQQIGDVLAAHKGAVVVLVEYRLSTFGHFPHPDLIEDAEPSVAYTDIKTALEWTHENVAAFGGDPDKIAISGTSAGGAAVQLLLEDDEAQGWFSAAWSGSGGGTGNYMGPNAFSGGYTWRTKTFGQAIKIAAPFLASQHPDYRTVADAIADQGFEWAMQFAVRPEHVQALADRAKIVTPASVKAAIDETGDLVPSFRNEPDNVYPFLRGDYQNATAAAIDGKFRKPFVSLWAECEALNLLGSDYFTIRNTLVALPTATLNAWAQRLGYADYAGFLNAAWIPMGGLENLPSAQFNPANGDAVVIANPDLEYRRVLYSHAVFGYPAYRSAVAMAETASAPAWLVCNNFSANGIWAGHSTEVPLMFGQVEWLVGGVQNFPSADPPGLYPNVRMDALYMSEVMMQKLVAFADTGDPDGAYSYAGFELFTGNPPADGGSITGTWTAYTGAQPGRMNVVGKYFDPVDNLNAGTFGPGGDIVAGLDLQRDARTTYADFMPDAMAEYRSLLE